MTRDDELRLILAEQIHKARLAIDTAAAALHVLCDVSDDDRLVRELIDDARRELAARRADLDARA